MDEQMQQQIVQLVQAAMQGDQQAQQQIQQIMQAAQQGDQQAAQIAQMIQQVAQELASQQQEQQTQIAKFGAKLNYLRQLKGKCPYGYEMQYYQSGGKVCKKCVKKQQDGGTSTTDNESVITRFKTESAKCGKKLKKKAACGTKLPMNKCGKQINKKANGGSFIPFLKKGLK